MNRIVVKSKVGIDGVLHLSLPVGLADAGEDVQVTVESYGPLPDKSQTPEVWRSWVQEMAGSWRGDFERPPQGDYEERESHLFLSRRDSSQ